MTRPSDRSWLGSPELLSEALTEIETAAYIAETTAALARLAHRGQQPYLGYLLSMVCHESGEILQRRSGTDGGDAMPDGVGWIAAH